MSEPSRWNTISDRRGQQRPVGGDVVGERAALTRTTGQAIVSATISTEASLLGPVDVLHPQHEGELVEHEGQADTAITPATRSGSSMPMPTEVMALTLSRMMPGTM
jgi:hypothetical protein